MKNNILCNFLLIPLVIFGSYSHGDSLRTNLGFQEAYSPKVPSLVKAQFSYIYRLKMPLFVSATEDEYDFFLANSATPANTRQDIQRCIDANLSVCVVHLGEMHGTAFLDEDGYSIWTNCHLIKDWIDYQKQELQLNHVVPSQWLGEILNSSIPVELTQEASNQIFSGSRETAFLDAAVIVDKSTPTQMTCSPQDDVVKIKLSRKLAEHGIKRSSRPLQTNEIYYIAGFPRPTDSRIKFKKNDSQGDRLYWTSGLNINKEKSLNNNLGKENLLGFALAGPYTQILLADSAEGMSGSPVLNKQGEMVGVFANFLPVDSQKPDIPLVSIFISNEGLKYVEIFSENLHPLKRH